MTSFFPGDSVVCRIYDNKIVNFYEETWEKEKNFEIISLFAEGYLLYIPLSFYLKDSVQLNSSNFKKYNADKRFIDSNAYYITDFYVIRCYNKLDGFRCIKCDTFHGMANANQEDGTFVCWHCRAYPFYK